MTTMTFDTLEFANELKASGMPDKQAEAISKVMRKAHEIRLEELATKKHDLQITIAEAKVEIIKWIAGMLVAQTGLIIAAFLAVAKMV